MYDIQPNPTQPNPIQTKLDQFIENRKSEFNEFSFDSGTVNDSNESEKSDHKVKLRNKGNDIN